MVNDNDMITVKIFRYGMDLEIWKLSGGIGWFRGQDFCLFELKLFEWCPDLDVLYIAQFQITHLCMYLQFEKE